MDNIGKSLNRPPSYPTKYFGCELGAQTRFDDKTARYIVNGAHEAGKLSELLDEFIKKFVLCPSCNNPETDLVIDRNNDIIRVCKACGQRHLVDMRHKLTTFIVNNPPPGAKKESTKKSKDGKKKDKKEKTMSTTTTMTTSLSSKKKMESGSEEEPDIEAPMIDQREDHEHDDTWGEDLDDEAIQRRAKDMESINEKLEKFNLSGSEEDTKDPTEQLFKALIDHKQKSQESIINEIEVSGLKRPDKISLVLASVLFDDDHLSAPLILKYASLLKQYAIDSKAQRNILIGMERALIHRTSLAAKIPIFFKSLYDNDIVNEEVFIKWSKKMCSRRYAVPRDVTKLIHEKAQVFIQWLETAEEESSSSEEED